MLNRYVQYKNNNGFHRFLAFSILQYLEVFWIQKDYTISHFVEELLSHGLSILSINNVVNNDL
jgi:hypothetical protein